MNILNTLFINFILSILLFSILINFFEPLLPNFISQIFRYGKLNVKGRQNKFIQILEVPKSYFKHISLFSLFCSFWGLYLTLKTIILKSPAPEEIMNLFDLIGGGKDRPVLIDSTSGLIAILLFFSQCLRRYYESWSMTIFSKTKMFIFYYLLGYLYYSAVVCTILVNTEGFVRGTNPSKFSLYKISYVQYACVILFYLAWNEQFKANKILVNLRKKKDGKFETEKHFIPNGGTFELISSPHMFFEIVMYFLLWSFMPHSYTWGLCVLWVIMNQIEFAWLTQKWYLENFPNYPKKRRAIIPYIF